MNEDKVIQFLSSVGGLVESVGLRGDEVKEASARMLAAVYVSWATKENVSKDEVASGASALAIDWVGSFLRAVEIYWTAVREGKLEGGGDK